MEHYQDCWVFVPPLQLPLELLVRPTGYYFQLDFTVCCSNQLGKLTLNPTCQKKISQDQGWVLSPLAFAAAVVVFIFPLSPLFPSCCSWFLLVPLNLAGILCLLPVGLAHTCVSCDIDYMKSTTTPAMSSYIAFRCSCTSTPQHTAIVDATSNTPSNQHTSKTGKCDILKKVIGLNNDYIMAIESF
jgi:hypothetical protein